jgi:hypothetical protein
LRELVRCSGHLSVAGAAPLLNFGIHHHLRHPHDHLAQHIGRDLR